MNPENISKVMDEIKRIRDCLKNDIVIIENLLENLNKAKDFEDNIRKSCFKRAAYDMAELARKRGIESDIKESPPWALL